MNYSMEKIANYQIAPGPLHRGGHATIRLLDSQHEKKLILDYTIDKKGIVPIPEKFLSGSYQFEFPELLKDEQGYLQIENDKIVTIGPVIIMHRGRRDSNQWSKAHWLEFKLENSRARGEIIYHPLAPGCGWSEIKIIIQFSLPLLDNYLLRADIS